MSKKDKVPPDGLPINADQDEKKVYYFRKLGHGDYRPSGHASTLRACGTGFDHSDLVVIHTNKLVPVEAAGPQGVRDNVDLHFTAGAPATGGNGFCDISKALSAARENDNEDIDPEDMTDDADPDYTEEELDEMLDSLLALFGEVDNSEDDADDLDDSDTGETDASGE